MKGLEVWLIFHLKRSFSLLNRAGGSGSSLYWASVHLDQ